MRQVVLLRGINLGSRNRIAMGQLRELLASAGLEDVRTYLQSGNVVVSSDLPPDRLAELSRSEIARAVGLEIDVIVRTRDELREVVKRNPLGEIAVDPKRYQVSFLSSELEKGVARELAALAVAPERFLAIGRELYAWHPDGVARSRLWAKLSARGLGVSATARNWSTVTSLLAMAEE